DSKLAKTKKILSYHSVQIEDQIKAVYETFYSYVDFDRLVIENGKPYDYDFTILRDYAYEMPDVHSRKMIEYLQLGNEISVPLAYVDSITLIREELYD
ncbi:MAG: hypothetical protein IKY44_05065, partial [Clostridia bacterium]|nr:hypothetical protein [Clostridia bacterium]